jgi:hypothetical protein
VGICARVVAGAFSIIAGAMGYFSAKADQLRKNDKFAACDDD